MAEIIAKIEKILESALQFEHQLSLLDVKRRKNRKSTKQSARSEKSNKVLINLYISYCQLSQIFAQLGSIKELGQFGWNGLSLCLIRLFQLYIGPMQQKGLLSQFEDLALNLGFSPKTRTYLAKKQVAVRRQDEDSLLGLNLHNLIYTQKSNYAMTFAGDIHSLPVTDTEILTYLEYLLASLKEGTDPTNLKLRFRQKKAAKQKLIKTEELIKNDLLTVTGTDAQVMDRLSSYSIQCTIQNGSESQRDLRSTLLLNFAIPLVVSNLREQFEDLGRSLLLIGDAGSGKSEWCRALASAGNANLIRIQPNSWKRKGPKLRVRLMSQICILCRHEATVICFDRLERLENPADVHENKLLSVHKSTFEQFLGELEELPRAVLLGMSRKSYPELDKEFSLVVSLSTPPAEARFSIIAERIKYFSMAGGELSVDSGKISHLVERTEGFTCGQVIKFCDKNM